MADLVLEALEGFSTFGCTDGGWGVVSGQPGQAQARQTGTQRSAEGEPTTKKLASKVRTQPTKGSRSQAMSYRGQLRFAVSRLPQT